MLGIDGAAFLDVGHAGAQNGLKLVHLARDDLGRRVVLEVTDDLSCTSCSVWETMVCMLLADRRLAPCAAAARATARMMLLKNFIVVIVLVKRLRCDTCSFERGGKSGGIGEGRSERGVEVLKKLRSVNKVQGQCGRFGRKGMDHWLLMRYM